MTAFDYVKSRATGDRLIEKFGTLAYVRRATASGDAAEPTETTVDHPTFATRVSFTQKQIARGNVQETDERWLVAAGPLATAGIEPKAPDVLVVGGVVKPILSTEPLKPSTVGVLFDCHIRV